MFIKKYIFAAAFMMLLLIGCGQSDQDEASEAAGGDLKPLDFVIDWLPGPTYLGVYYAVDIGEFEKAGYLTTVRVIQGANRVVGSIGAGTYLVGIASGAATVLGRGHENDSVPIKSLGVLYKDIPSAVYGIASKTMAKTPKDLEGMTVGLYPGSITNDEFGAFIKANNLDANKINKIAITSSEGILLTDGTVDAVLQYTELNPAEFDVDENIPKVEGKRTWRLMLRDHGVKSYGVNLVTSEKALAEQGEELKKIAQAVFNGYKKACENKDDAVSRFIDRFPDKNKTYVNHGFTIVCDQLIQPIGSQTNQGWQDTIDLFVGLGLLKEGSVKPQDVIAE